jgi:hypothetical protein
MKRKLFRSALAALPLLAAAVTFGLAYANPSVAQAPAITGGFTCPLTGEELPCPTCCPLNRGKAPAKAPDCCLDPTCPPGCSADCPPDCLSTAKVKPTAKADDCCPEGGCCPECCLVTARAKAPAETDAQAPCCASGESRPSGATTAKAKAPANKYVCPPCPFCPGW